MYLADSNVPESVYDNLLSAVHEALPMMYRYVAVRKKVLGVDKLHMYDVYTPIVAAQNQTYEFEQAKQMVLEALKPMGEDYLSHAREGLKTVGLIFIQTRERKAAHTLGSATTHSHSYC